MGIHRISRQSTSSLSTFASSSLTSSSLAPRSVPPPRRHASTAVSRSTVHLDDPYERILPPKFPSHEERERARAALVKHIGSDPDIKLSLLPFWSVAYTFHGDVFYYLPSKDNSLIRHSVPGHPFLITSEVCALRDPSLTTLQFPTSPQFYLRGSKPPSPHNPPCPVLPVLNLEQLENQPSSLSDPFGPPVRFSLGPPRPLLQALYIPAPTSDVKKGHDIFSLPIKAGPTVAAPLKTPATIRGMFPRGGTMARIMDQPEGFDRVACPIRKPLLIAYEQGGRPVAAIDPISMTIQSSVIEEGRTSWKDMTSTYHNFSQVTGGAVSNLLTAQFTGSHLVVAPANREKLDWTADYIHSLRPDRIRTNQSAADLANGAAPSAPPSQLSHIRNTFTTRLMTTKGSVQAHPMKSAGRDEAAANARQKLLEAEGMAERLQMAAARQKRLKAEAELQTRLTSQMDAKKRERVLAQKRTAEKQKKHLESKFAKSKRVEDRQREDEKRRRLEEAMATAARELYGSRRTKVSIRSKILDPQSHYQMLGLVSLNIMPTDAEIKEAWRAQMQAHHPDRPGGSTEKAAQINSAADALSTEDKRTAYQRDGFWNGSGGR